MEPVVVTQLGVERRHDHPILAAQHGPVVDGRQDLDLGAHRVDHGRPDEHRPERPVVVEPAHRQVGLEGIDLAAERVAAHGRVDGVERPLVVAPGAAAATAAIVLVSIRANRFAQNWVLIMSLASVLVPALLELAGVLPPSYTVTDGRLTIAPNFFAFQLEPTLALLVISAVLTVALTVFGVGRAVDALVRAERRNFAQAWRLRQILPG